MPVSLAKHPAIKFTETHEPMKRTKYSILNGGDETTVYHLQAPTDGPTAVVIGGLHGNERAGIQAADLIRLWSIESGEIVVIPRANKRACDRGTRQAAGAPDLNRQFPSGSEPEGDVAKGLWEEITRHDPDYVFDLHRSVGLYQRPKAGVGMAIYPTPGGRSIAEDALGHLNDDHVQSGNAGFRIGNDQNGGNPLLSHKVGGDLVDTVGWLIETTSHDQEMDVRVTQLEHAIETLLYHADNGDGIVVEDYGHSNQEPNSDILDEYEDSGGDDEEETPGIGLDHEGPLAGYHPKIGGSADPEGETHGGNNVSRPDAMPTKSDCDHVVRNVREFSNAATEDNTSIYIDETVDEIDISVDVRANGGINIGSGLTIVAGFCDPNIPGRGPEIVCETNGYRALISGYGEAPTLWGVSMRGPRLDYFDPDHTASDFPTKQSTGLFCHDTEGTLEVYGSEFRGWTMAGLEIGARNRETTAEVQRSSFHHNQMEHLGYGIQQYNGTLECDLCFFNRNRHAIAGFGWPSQSYTVKRSLLGPEGLGHGFDEHCLANNLDSQQLLDQFEYGGKTAGGNIEIEETTMMLTRDIKGRRQESFAHRGRTIGEARLEKIHFWHTERPQQPNVQGNAYRQEMDEWTDFYVEDSAFGPEQLTDGIGAPRARKGHEDDDQPEQEDPSGQPNETMPQLMIHGRGPSGEYRIEVDGDVSPGPTMDKVESINDLGDNRHEITGRISHATDSFELADDATPISASIDVPARITVDGDDRTAELVGPGASIRFDEQQGQLNHLQAQLDKLRLWASELGEALSFSAGDDG